MAVCGDEIARAHLGGVDAELCREAIDDPFHCEYGLRPSGAAVGSGEARIGEDGAI